ncbi:unnamed protein product [Polarella glacialis]|uniref:Uncharacterized protein n=1 Tax=Polarella glacialis TaxID=89957 RepID=A0A813L241_POLGL|nr:unnamed protein product [Polarella glacialis]CAE8720936.1 unnamed protein product [Polarella glacialis]
MGNSAGTCCSDGRPQVNELIEEVQGAAPITHVGSSISPKPSSVKSCFFLDQLNCTEGSTGPLSLPCCQGFWRDTDSNPIEAHGGSMLQHEGMFYWYGETTKNCWGTSVGVAGVNLYISSSLTGPWQKYGQIIDATILGNPTLTVMERPKVLYCKENNTFVLWMHVDDAHYQTNRAAVCTANFPEGPWSLVHVIAPGGKPSLDLTVFLDPLNNECAVLARDARDIHAPSWSSRKTILSKLTTDFKDVDPACPPLCTWTGDDSFEGMALFYEGGPPYPQKGQPARNGAYWIIGSPRKGWTPSPLIAWRSTWGKTLLDQSNSWSRPNFSMSVPQSFSAAPAAQNMLEYALNSQPNWVQQVQDGKGENYFVYMGDNWILGEYEYATNPQDDPNAPLVKASYVWLPFNTPEGKVDIEARKEWDPAAPFA